MPTLVSRCAKTSPVSPPIGEQSTASPPSTSIIRATQKPWPPAWRCNSSSPASARSIVTVTMGAGANTQTLLGAGASRICLFLCCETANETRTTPNGRCAYRDFVYARTMLRPMMW